LPPFGSSTSSIRGKDSGDWGERMNKKPNIKEIIAKNPGVDPQKLQQGLEAIQELKKTGVVRQSTYSLETPTTARPVVARMDTAPRKPGKAGCRAVS
jgi:hypothetical protein